MNLGQLKKALRKLPPDMDDMEIMIITGENGRKKYDLLCFTGYIPLEGHEAIALGASSAVKVMVEKGEMPKPEGYDGFMDKFDENE
jgi:hypothetical protein